MISFFPKHDFISESKVYYTCAKGERGKETRSKFLSPIKDIDVILYMRDA